MTVELRPGSRSAAFVSYSPNDEAIARWLQGRLEAYPVSHRG